MIQLTNPFAIFLLIFIIIMIIINWYTFRKYGEDKLRAENGGWRIPEKNLLILSLFGGWIGAFLAMQHFRHKTQKTNFKNSHLAVTIINILVLGFILVNLLRRIEENEIDSNLNKFNTTDCGPKLSISEDGLGIKHLGPNIVWNSVRAKFPIPRFNLNANKSSINFYFEVQILEKNDNMNNGIGIGFSLQKFPLEGKWLGSVNNSIGIDQKGGMEVYGYWQKFDEKEGWFQKGDFVGIGIINSPRNSSMECFATLNGELLAGKAETPLYDNTFEIFPTVTLYYPDDSIRAYFKKEEWRFKKFNKLL